MFDSERGYLFPEEDAELLYRLTVEPAEELSGREVLPNDVEGIFPGLFLAAILVAVDRSKLSGYDTVRLMQADARLVSHFNSRFYADMAEVAHAIDPDTTARDQVPVEYAVEEVQTALHLTRRAAETELDLAWDLSSRMPRVWEALQAGYLDLYRARVFARELETLDQDQVAVAVDRVIGKASGLTTGQLRARLQQTALSLDPDGARQRFNAGIEDRKLVVQANPDHTASLLIHNIDPVDALHASRYIHGLALDLSHQPGETRTLDQLRADITCDLLTGKNTRHYGPRSIQIQVNLTGEGVHVPGYGPVLPETVEELLANTQEKNVVSGDDTCAHATASRRPTTTQIRHLRGRYPSCVFPGCRIPSVQCDLDHRKPWNQNGPTSCHNLAPLCRHHHVCKTKSRWQLQRKPDNSHTWTSPLGHTYQTGRPP